ncbi:sigma-E processing peptidase SpoIIGA [Aminipila butyrica]|uniref:Sporulation sigma-E factor-processing peptidase n=1 Tax=Aminipila butyrica TaxID=433296 RepID=A0A858BWE0_9FIRM|nr:sigma-E processing peptidase SpoIIGA [Aminipila butyrica]QIB69897.1 sigma-E processing peptidase SpoIIGA [Aminipila butyrica]
MEVYGEYLFMENFLMGLLILHLAGKIAGLVTSKKRLAAGGVLCGLFSFILFVPNLGMGMGTLVKLLFSALLAWVVFHKKIFRAMVLIYLVSAFMGGMTILLLYLTRISGMTSNAVLYIGDIGYVNVAFGAVVSWLLVLAFSRVMAVKQLRERIFTEVIIEIGGHQLVHRALIDSGNFLREPLSGKAVVVISKGAAAQLKQLEDADLSRRYCLIPYNSIGVSHGLLEGYRVDNARVEGRNLGSVVVAVYDREFCRLGEEETYEILLSKDFLMGGIAS